MKIRLIQLKNLPFIEMRRSWRCLSSLAMRACRESVSYLTRTDEFCKKYYTRMFRLVQSKRFRGKISIGTVW